MGFKAIEMTPIASNGPTVLTPVNKDVVAKAFAVTRSDTTTSVKCVLPADATIISFSLYSTAVSNAATTANISVGIPGNATYFINAADVKTAAGRIALTSNLTNMFNLENTPLGADIQLTATYAETGTASTSGGPYYVLVEYVR